MLEILNTGISSAEENMRFDEKLLENLLPTSKPILHLYRWANPSATFGYFIDPKEHLRQSSKIDLARRPTGGGILFHIWDLAFSFLMPAEHPRFSQNTLENYQFVNNAVLQAVQSYFSLPGELIPDDAPSLAPECKNFCMAKPTQYDVVYRGTKIAGAAQRKRKQGYLHQGTISLLAPNIELLQELLLSSQVVTAMTAFTFSPLRDASQLETVRSDLEKLLADKLQQALNF
jgi:lipoate-protein ligase A